MAGRFASARRVLGRLLLLTALLLSVGLAVDLPGVRGQVDRRLEDLASVVTGEPVLIEDVRIHLWPPALTVHGLVVGESGSAAIQADRVYAQPGIRAGRPVLSVLALDRPQVRLVLDEEGLRGFTALRQGEATLDEFPWDELIVNSGYLEVEFTSVDTTLQLEGLGVRPDLEPGRFDLSVGAVEVRVGETRQRSQPTRVLGATLGPGDVRLPRVDLDFPMVDLWGQVEKDLDGKGRADLQLDVDLDALSEALPGPLKPSGRVRLDLEVDGPSAEGALLTELVLVDEETGDHYDFEEAVGVLALSPEGVVVQPLRWHWADGEVVADGFLGWDGTVEDLRVQGEGIDLARALQRTDVSDGAWVDFTGDLEAQLDGTLAPLAIQGPFTLAAQHLRTGAGPMEDPGADPLIALSRGWIDGDLTLDAEGITLDGRQVVLGRTSGSVEATIGFTSQGPLSLSADVNLDLRDLAPLADVNLEGRGRVTGTLQGPFDSLQVAAQAALVDFRLFGFLGGESLQVDQVRADLGADVVVLELGDLVSRVGDTSVRGDIDLVFEESLGLDLGLEVEEGKVSDLLGVFSETEGLDGLVSGTLTLHGSPEALDGQFDLGFREVDLFGERFGVGEAHGRLEEGSFLLEQAVLERGGGTGRLSGNGQVANDGTLDIQVTGEDLHLADLDTLADEELPLEGVLELDLTLGGSLDHWEPAGELTLHQTLLGEEAVGDSRLSFTTEDDLWVFNGDLLGEAVWCRGTLEGAAPHLLHLDGGLADLPLDVFVPRAADGRAIVARASGGLVLDGSLDDADLEGELVLDQVKLAWGAQEIVNPEPWRLTLTGETLSWENLRLVGGETSLETQGQFSPAQGWQLDGTGQLDMAWLGAAVPEVTRSVGTAHLGFHQDGGDTRLEATGTVSVLQAAWFPHPFEDVTFSVQGTEEGYQIGAFAGTVGGGDLAGSGSLEAEGWIPTRYELVATLEEGRIKLLEDLPAATGSASLRLAGSPDALLLSGDVVIEEMRFVERIDWESWLLEPGEELLVEMDAPSSTAPLFAYDLLVQADGTVLVRNNVGEGTCDAQLTVLGDTNRVGMTGWVRMRPGGTLNLQNRVFEVRRAELRYVEPWSFDPELDFDLATRVASGDTDYAISYRVGGPYSDWSTSASSEPSLPMADINALLLFGMTREQVERAGGINAALLMEGLDLVTGVRQGRAEARLTGGRLDVMPDRIDLVTGMSPRGDSVSSDWRLLAEKELGEWTLTGDINLADWDQRYWAIERDLAGAMYLTLYRASLEEEAGLPVDGAWGADLVWRWELE